MTIGELDYTTMIVDNFNVTTDSGAPLVPYREASLVFLSLFIFAIPIVLMNLLVSEFKCINSAYGQDGPYRLSHVQWLPFGNILLTVRHYLLLSGERHLESEVVMICHDLSQ